MTSYPVRVTRQHYRGSDPRKQIKVDKRNRVAALIEESVSNDLAKRPNDTFNVYLNFIIAGEIGANLELFRDIVCGIDGGSNSVTFIKEDHERTMNKRPMPPETRAGIAKITTFECDATD